MAHSTRIAGLPVRRPTMSQGKNWRIRPPTLQRNPRILAHLEAARNRVSFWAERLSCSIGAVNSLANGTLFQLEACLALPPSR